MIRETMFEDFFGRELPHEGFTIEELEREYFILTDQTHVLPQKQEGHGSESKDETQSCGKGST